MSKQQTEKFRKYMANKKAGYGFHVLRFKRFWRVSFSGAEPGVLRLLGEKGDRWVLKMDFIEGQELDMLEFIREVDELIQGNVEVLNDPEFEEARKAKKRANREKQIEWLRKVAERG